MSDYYTPYVQIAIEMDNAAFDDHPEMEAARILKELAASIERVGFSHAPCNLRDINGNTVGAFSYYNPEDD